jgi:putative addiction module killer protein
MQDELEIRIYKAGQDRSQFSGWRRSLHPKSRQIVDANISKLRNPSFKNYKRVGEVFELRIFLDSGYRVYFGIHHRQAIILLLGGDKDSQERDIQKAQDLWRQFKSEIR